MTTADKPNADTLSTDDNLGKYALGNRSNTLKNWRFFGLLLLMYFIFWSIAPPFFASSVPLDVSEGIYWGSEWQLGYYKHPPSSSWVLYSFYKVLGHFGPYLLSQLCVLLTLIFTYLLARKFWSPTISILGSSLSLAVIYYTYPSLEFNHNVAQFPIWAGLYLTFYQAVTQNRMRDWLLFGVLGGLGMLTKYSVIFLLLPMALYLCLPKQWSLLRQPNPWIAAVIMLTIFAPHLYWLMMNDWLPFNYASERAQDVGESASHFKRHFSWMNFIAAQLIVHIPLIIILIFNRKYLLPINQYRQSLPDGASLLWYLWLSPLIVLIILSLGFGVGLRDMWGMPMWALSGTLVASFIIPSLKALAVTRLRKSLMVWLTLATTLSFIYVGFGDQLRHKPSRMQWPEQALATQAQNTWKTLSSCSLDSVSGDRWLGALIAINSGFPSLMISGPASHSPWMTTQRLQDNGTLVIWQDGEEDIVLPLLSDLVIENSNENANINNTNTLVKTQGQWQIAWRDKKAEIPLMVNWLAYVPSRCIPPV